MGIEPTSQPWEGRILPMNYTRILHGCIIAERLLDFNCFFSPACDKIPCGISAGYPFIP